MRSGAADFARRLWLRAFRPDPIVRKVVIHLGMPKAGSTSIQLALHAAQESILACNGIWFAPLDAAFNDCIMYDMLAANDLASLRRYAEAKMWAAARAGADVVIFSAERLFTIEDVKKRMRQLAEAMQPWAAEVSFAVVAREIRDFLRSYIVQMIYNVEVTLEDHGLAEWVIDQVGLITESGLPVDVIALDVPDGDRNLAERLVSMSTAREVEIALTRANVTPSRPLLYALTEGLVARMRAIELGIDINATELDSFRTAFATAYDDSVHSTSDPGEVYRVLQRMNKIVEDHIAEYIDCCLQECPAEKLAFYDEILASAASESSTMDRRSAVHPLAVISNVQTLRSPDSSRGDRVAEAPDSAAMKRTA